MLLWRSIFDQIILEGSWQPVSKRNRAEGKSCGLFSFTISPKSNKCDTVSERERERERERYLCEKCIAAYILFICSKLHLIKLFISVK